MASFGENLKRLRDRAGLTQEAVAERLSLKRPTPISLWEGPRKHIVPKPETIKKLAAALGAQTWELLDGVETEYDKLRKAGPTQAPRSRVAEMPARAQLIAALARNTETLEAIDDVASDLFDILAQVEGLRPGKKPHAKSKRQAKRQADREGSVR